MVDRDMVELEAKGQASATEYHRDCDIWGQQEERKK